MQIVVQVDISPNFPPSSSWMAAAPFGSGFSGFWSGISSFSVRRNMEPLSIEGRKVKRERAASCGEEPGLHRGKLRVQSSLGCLTWPPSSGPEHDSVNNSCQLPCAKQVQREAVSVSIVLRGPFQKFTAYKECEQNAPGLAHPKPMPSATKKKPCPPAVDALAEPLDPQQSAKEAGLRYVSDAKPGIQRKKFRSSFRYISPDGKPVKDEAILGRIKSLVIPPAWQDVWISPHANGHLQATGRDAKGRKQSRYHPKWREVRDETKYERMTHFAAALPGLRERIDHDLALPGLPRHKVLATIVSLMETTHIRVGNAEYARDNQSYGLTTMRTKHVEVHGSKITFSFQGKSRVHHTINLQDRRLAGIIKRCADIPGYELFQYLDPDGERHSIDSSDVNEYLRDITGQHFTAKDFRTWAGSVLACDMLREFEPFTTATEAKKNVVKAITAVAARLGNTPSVCRKCYVHPAVLEAYLGGTTIKSAKQQLDEEIAERTNALHQEELLLLDLLEQRMMLEEKTAS